MAVGWGQLPETDLLITSENDKRRRWKNAFLLAHFFLRDKVMAVLTASMQPVATRGFVSPTSLFYSHIIKERLFCSVTTDFRAWPCSCAMKLPAKEWRRNWQGIIQGLELGLPRLRPIWWQLFFFFCFFKWCGHSWGLLMGLVFQS